MNFQKSDLERIFSGIPKDKLEAAIKKADVLSKNPDVRNKFSKISENDIKNMLGALSGNDKEKLNSSLKSGNGREIVELIKRLK